MASIKFLPSGQTVEKAENLKVLVSAIRHKVDIRYGCASCRCGTCGVKIVQGREFLSDLESEESKLLQRMGLEIDGSIRLACRAKVGPNQEGSVEVDLDFQDTYSPDGLES